MATAKKRHRTQKKQARKKQNGHKTVPNQSVYSATKFAMRAISQGLRQEGGDKLRVTIISPGFVRTNFAEGVTKSGRKGSACRVSRQIRAAARSDRPGHCVRDRAAGRC